MALLVMCTSHTLDILPIYEKSKIVKTVKLTVTRERVEVRQVSILYLTQRLVAVQMVCGTYLVHAWPGRSSRHKIQLWAGGFLKHIRLGAERQGDVATVNHAHHLKALAKQSKV